MRDNIRIVKISLTFAITKLISASQQWHFFATSHGKGPCDGLGGTIKRLATKASLQRCTEGMHSEQILSPTAFFEFCCQNIKNIEFVFTTYNDYDEESNLLSSRHSEAITIAGTQQFHFFSPVSLNEVCVKPYTDSPISVVKKVAHASQSLSSDDQLKTMLLLII